MVTTYPHEFRPRPAPAHPGALGLPRNRTKAVRLPDSIDLGRLCDTVSRDRRELEPFRRNRLEALRQYGGARYGGDCAPAEVPVNLLGLYVEVITQTLVDQAPRVMLSTFDRSKAAMVDSMQEWLNEELVRMRVAETYKRAVYDALFCVGIVKCALATPVDAAMEAWDVLAGQPFLETIDLDDVVLDTTAREFSRMAYCGYRYRVPVELANEVYAKGRAEKLEASDPIDVNTGGDERVYTLSGTRGSREELEDHCDLWEVYLARHKVVLTLRDAGGLPDPDHGPLRVQPWVGPPAGPFHFLSFGLMPGNLIPKAPVMDLVDLHRHHNQAYRKLLRRTRDSKAITAYGNADDAERVRKANDGDMIQVNNPELMKTIESGGPTNDLLVMTDHIKAMFSFRGGNLELLGGRSPQARTASQDKMLNENAGAGVAALASAYQSFVEDTVGAVLWYAHHHPTKVMRSAFSPPSDPTIRGVRTLTPEDRTGPPPDLKIDPYSLPRQTPASRLAFINQTVQTIAPMMALLAQQGKLPDMDALLKLFAKYGNEPDLTTIFGLTLAPAPGNAGTGSPDAGMPAQTTRTYERYSHGGQGAQQQAQQLNQNVSRMEGPANPNSGGE